MYFYKNLITAIVVVFLFGCNEETVEDYSQMQPSELYTLAKAYYVGDRVERNQEKSIELYKLSADGGYAQAQYYLAFLYATGNSVEKDFSKATEYYKKAADQGIVEAQAVLGETLYKPSDLLIDKKEALEYLKMSAVYDPNGMTELAKIYIDGKLAPKDDKKAVELLSNASNYKDPQALVMLGRMYLYGTNGILKDYYNGLSLIKIALNQPDNNDALLVMSDAYFAGLGVEQSDEKALDYLKKAANQNSLEAIRRIGNYYLNFEDYSNASQWFNKLAENGDLDSQIKMARFYENGIGVEQSDEKARKWYEEAQKQGYKDAGYHIALLSAHNPNERQQALQQVSYLRETAFQNNKEDLKKLYYFYADIEGVNDEERAIDILHYIVDFKDYDLQFIIGYDHYQGINHVAENKELGKELILSSAKSGYSDAAYTLGEWYQSGELSEDHKPNKILAYVWYSIAGSNNNATAKKKLIKLNRNDLKKANAEIIAISKEIKQQQLTQQKEM